MPTEDWSDTIEAALDNFETSPHVLQKFYKSKQVRMPYYDFEKREMMMMITPAPGCCAGGHKGATHPASGCCPGTTSPTVSRPPGSGTCRHAPPPLPSRTLPTKTVLPGDYSTDALPPGPLPYWDPRMERHPDPSLRHLVRRSQLRQSFGLKDLPHLELELALCMGLREYIKKTGLRSLTLAPSGGKIGRAHV